MNITEKKNAGKYYSAAYYLDGCGPDYNDRDFWCPQFQKIAEKINSIYNDVNTAKTFVKWYLIIAGIAAGIVLILFAYFIINSLFVW